MQLVLDICLCLASEVLMSDMDFELWFAPIGLEYDSTLYNRQSESLIYGMLTDMSSFWYERISVVWYGLVILANFAVA